MRCTILIDNRPCPEAFPENASGSESGNRTYPGCEHGFSLLFEADGRHFLLDTGASGKFAGNAALLEPEIPLSRIDALILSHAHNDHTGGLRTFLEQNTTAPVYLSRYAFDTGFYSCRQKEPVPGNGELHAVREFRSIGISQAVLNEYSERICRTEGSRQISESVFLIDIRYEQERLPEKSRIPFPVPAGNRTLYADDFPDSFRHELAVVVKEPDGATVLSPCSHCGILNILSACRNVLNGLRIKTFIGGMHLVEYIGKEGKKCSFESENELRELARLCSEHYPDMKIISGHCTSDSASRIFKEILQERYDTFYSGYRLPQEYTLYIGTYGPRLLWCRFDPQTLRFSVPDGIPIENTSCLTPPETFPDERPESTRRCGESSRRIFYTLSESGPRSAVHAVLCDPAPRRIRTLHRIGENPCYLIYGNGSLYTADYTGGSISSFSADASGSPVPGPAIRFTGNGPHPRRQLSPHIHTVRIFPEPTPARKPLPVPDSAGNNAVSGNRIRGSYLLATDLGCDKLYLFRKFPEPNDPPFIALPPGSGPRHLAFHPSLPYLYLLTELSGEIFVYRIGESPAGGNGTGGIHGTAYNLQLSLIQQIAADDTGAQASGDIHASPDGRHLYASNRNGKDGIVIFTIAPDGTLRPAGFQPTARHPRNFILVPDGTLLLAACKNDRVVQVFRRDPESGMLSGPAAELRLESEEPVCLQIAPCLQ